MRSSSGTAARTAATVSIPSSSLAGSMRIFIALKPLSASCAATSTRSGGVPTLISERILEAGPWS